jgi:hypothetical protein
MARKGQEVVGKGILSSNITGVKPLLATWNFNLWLIIVPCGICIMF